jgi:16S rRNA (adenine1518-N6/adenine1519-N6)-dimethyltransferase
MIQLPSARDRLENRLKELGIVAKKSLGQNFLVSDLVIQKIIQAAVDLKPDRMIEVGPGPGALTDYLVNFEKPLQLIELDRNVAHYWRERGFSVIEEDALRLNWQQFITDENLILVSNLPYQISSSIVIDRSVDPSGVKAMVLMFQKEVAQRIRASEQSDQYGLLSVIAQNFWKIETVTDAGPRDFDPAPKVASRVLKFIRRESHCLEPNRFLTFAKVAFAQRRKLLKANLRGLPADFQYTEEKLLSWVQQNGYKETLRAEELSPQKMMSLYEHFNHSRK